MGQQRRGNLSLHPLITHLTAPDIGMVANHTAGWDQHHQHRDQPNHDSDGRVHFPFVDGAHVGVLIQSLVEAFAESPVQFLVENLKESLDFVEFLVEP